MGELARTKDPVVISAIEGVLVGADIPYQVADRNISVIEGSINAFQVRVLVPDEYESTARALLSDAALGSGFATKQLALPAATMAAASA